MDIECCTRTKNPSEESSEIGPRLPATALRLIAEIIGDQKDDDLAALALLRKADSSKDY